MKNKVRVQKYFSELLLGKATYLFAINVGFFFLSGCKKDHDNDSSSEINDPVKWEMFSQESITELKYKIENEKETRVQANDPNATDIAKLKMLDLYLPGFCEERNKEFTNGIPYLKEANEFFYKENKEKFGDAAARESFNLHRSTKVSIKKQAELAYSSLIDQINQNKNYKVDGCDIVRLHCHSAGAPCSLAMLVKLLLLFPTTTKFQFVFVNGALGGVPHLSGAFDKLDNSFLSEWISDFANEYVSKKTGTETDLLNDGTRDLVYTNRCSSRNGEVKNLFQEFENLKDRVLFSCIFINRNNRGKPIDLANKLGLGSLAVKASDSGFISDDYIRRVGPTDGLVGVDEQQLHKKDFPGVSLHTYNLGANYDHNSIVNDKLYAKDVAEKSGSDLLNFLGK